MQARWAHAELIRRLAQGADPGDDPALRSAAERLAGSHRRSTIAGGLERVVAGLDKPATPMTAAVPVRTRFVRGARHELMRLAGELRHMPHPDPRGVAMAERLLTEPDSPLYIAVSSDEIARAARNAAAGLLPRTSSSAPDALARTTRRFCAPTVSPIAPQPPIDSVTR